MYIITILDKRKQLQAYEDARSYAEPKKGFQHSQVSSMHSAYT